MLYSLHCWLRPYSPSSLLKAPSLPRTPPARAGLRPSRLSLPPTGMPPLGPSGYNNERLQSFSILAYIDHGKLTLVTCLLETTRTMTALDMKAQLLDGLDLGRKWDTDTKRQASRCCTGAQWTRRCTC